MEVAINVVDALQDLGQIPLDRANRTMPWLGLTKGLIRSIME
jgi:hypothetical protein